MAYITFETIEAERAASRAKLRYATLGVIAVFFILAVASGVALSPVTIIASIFFSLVSHACLALFVHVMTHPYFK